MADSKEKLDNFRLGLSLYLRRAFPLPEHPQSRTLETTIVRSMAMNDSLGVYSRRKYTQIFNQALEFGFNRSDARQTVLHVIWGDVCMHIAPRKAVEDFQAQIRSIFCKREM